MGELPLPMVLRVEADVPLVARADVWEELLARWDDALAGDRRIVLLAGEAGAGKSRLAGELARHVHTQGAVVLHGSCPDGGSRPFGSFREAVEEFVRGCATSGALRLEPADLERLRPLLEHAGGSRGAPAEVSDERFLAATAVTELLERASGAGPVLLILDDLHWVDAATADLVDHLARSGRPSGCVIVVTHRLEPADVTPAARSMLAALRRRPDAQRIPVHPFDREGIRAFVEAAAGHHVHIGLDPIVDHLLAQTGGNPFFLGELWHHLVETGRLVRPSGRWRLAGPLADSPSPPAVRDVVAARLAALPEETRAIVETAAVVGGAFDLAVLADAAEVSPSEVLTLLGPACEARVVEEPLSGSGRFAHGLVRRAAYDAQPVDARHRRHLAVARAFERSGRAGTEVSVAEHLIAAVPLVERSEAVAAASAAAANAFADGRYTDAAAALHAALGLADAGLGRSRLLLRLADSNMRAGDVAGAQEAALEAHELGIRGNDAGLIVGGALAFEEANWRGALPGHSSLRVLDTALTHAADERAGLRLRAARSRALALSGRDDEARAVADEALAEARGTGDADAQCSAYTALLFTSWTPDAVDRLLRAARDFVDLAVATGNTEWEVGAVDKLLHGSIVRGDLDEARTLAARHATLARAVGQPLFLVRGLQVEALLAMAEGRFAEAERCATAARDLGTRMSGRDASGGFGVQLFSLRREQGGLEEARPFLDSDDPDGLWRPGLAVLAAELGMEDRAVTVLDELVAADLRTVPRDSLWPAALAYLTEAAVRTGHRTAAERLLPELEPYRGLVVQAGSFLAAYGAADRYLGMLQGVVGSPAARSSFEAALRLETRTRMAVWVARTQCEYGRYLANADEPGDADRGATLLRFAADAAHRLGMRSVEQTARSALGGVPSATGSRPPATADLTDRELAVLRLVAEGRSNRQIGTELSISHHTAANHVRAILLKAGCSNRTEAAAWALRHGLTAP